MSALFHALGPLQKCLRHGKSYSNTKILYGPFGAIRLRRLPDHRRQPRYDSELVSFTLSSQIAQSMWRCHTHGAPPQMAESSKSMAIKVEFIRPCTLSWVSFISYPNSHPTLGDGSIRSAYISIDTEWNTPETWGLRRLFSEGARFPSQINLFILASSYLFCYLHPCILALKCTNFTFASLTPNLNWSYYYLSLFHQFISTAIDCRLTPLEAKSYIKRNAV